MTSLFSRWFSKEIEPLEPGIYHSIASEGSTLPYRLHLRVEDDETGILIVNASTVLHLNPTAVAYALQIVKGASATEAAKAVSRRYRVSIGDAIEDFEVLQQKIITLATNPDVDPVLFMDLDRAEPYVATPSAPYRLDIALTYSTNPDGELDPLARARVDRELNSSEWKEILSKAWEAGIPHVTFTGGEPTRREDLVELITFAEELGQVTGVLTDGRRFADSGYVEELFQVGIDHFLIAFVPDSEECLSGIKNAVASDVFTAVHLTITDPTEDFALKWLDLLRELQVETVSITTSESSEMANAAVAQAREYAAELDLALVWDIPAPYSKRNPIALEVAEASSGAGRAWLYVEPDGDVLPEQGVNKILGNFLTDTWDVLWNKARDQEEE